MLSTLPIIVTLIRVVGAHQVDPHWPWEAWGFCHKEDSPMPDDFAASAAMVRCLSRCWCWDPRFFGEDEDMKMIWRYGWWFRNPAITSWYGKFIPIIYKVLAPSQVIGRISEPSTVWRRLGWRFGIFHPAQFFGKGLLKLSHDLGGGNSNDILNFHPLFGEMIQFDEHIFQMGWDHQPEDMKKMKTVKKTNTLEEKSDGNLFIPPADVLHSAKAMHRYPSKEAVHVLFTDRLQTQAFLSSSFCVHLGSDTVIAHADVYNWCHSPTIAHQCWKFIDDANDLISKIHQRKQRQGNRFDWPPPQPPPDSAWSICSRWLASWCRGRVSPWKNGNTQMSVEQWKKHWLVGLYRGL